LNGILLHFILLDADILLNFIGLNGILLNIIPLNADNPNAILLNFLVLF
jgi:hypothetical protein